MFIFIFCFCDRERIFKCVYNRKLHVCVSHQQNFHVLHRYSWLNICVCVCVYVSMSISIHSCD